MSTTARQRKNTCAQIDSPLQKHFCICCKVRRTVSNTPHSILWLWKLQIVRCTTQLLLHEISVNNSANFMFNPCTFHCQYGIAKMVQQPTSQLGCISDWGDVRKHSTQLSCLTINSSHNTNKPCLLSNKRKARTTPVKASCREFLGSRYAQKGLGMGQQVTFFS